MITVDCSQVLPIKHSLMIFVAENVEGFPTSKQTKFVITSIEGHKDIQDWQVVLAIRSFLKKIGERKNFEVISKNSNILIKSNNGSKIKGSPPNIPEVPQKRYTWEGCYS